MTTKACGVLPGTYTGASKAKRVGAAWMELKSSESAGNETCEDGTTTSEPGIISF